MKFQNMFSWKNIKRYFKSRLLKILRRVLNVKQLHVHEGLYLCRVMLSYTKASHSYIILINLTASSHVNLILFGLHKF